MMLRIFDVAVELVREVEGIAEGLDRDWARQLRRSMLSVALNIAEGDGQSGGHRRQRYMTALGSARESLANLQCAVAVGSIGPISGETRNRFDHVIGTLVKIVYRRRE